MCANGGGGGCPPPTTPPLSFLRRAGFSFKNNCIINKTCFAHIIVIRPVQINTIVQAVYLQTRELRPPEPPCWQCICELRGYIRPNPRTSLSCTRPRQVSSCQQNRTHMAPFRTCDKDVVCANGGGCAPPPPQLPHFSVYAVQICFQEHHCFKNPSCRQMGGYIPPNSCAFLICARSLQVSSCQLRQNPYGTNSEPVIKKIYDEPE